MDVSDVPPPNLVSALIDSQSDTNTQVISYSPLSNFNTSSPFIARIRAKDDGIILYFKRYFAFVDLRKWTKWDLRA